jgi:hypothetical protein
LISSVKTEGKRLLDDIMTQLITTTFLLITAVKERSMKKGIDLLRDGAPVELLIDDVVEVVCWVLVVLPMLLIPVYYLGVYYGLFPSLHLG